MAETFDIDINFNVNGLENLQEGVEALQQLQVSVEAVQPSTESLGSTTEESGEKIGEMGDKSSESASEVNVLGDAISAVASLGLAAEFNNTATAADNYNVSMAALSQVASNNNISLDGVSSAISKVTDATSIGGGQARSYFTMLMNLGVTNTDALAQSMISLKGQSAITGNSIEAMSSKLTTVVNGTSLSARSLTNLGLSLQQLATTNGMSVEEIKSAWSTMTADEKLQALNNAMSENSGLVATMNQTTSEQLQEVQNSWASLQIAVGQSSSGMSQAMLGVANGAIQGLTSAVKNIPFASTFASGALAAGSLVTGMKPAMDTFNSLSRTVSSVSTVIGGVSDAIGVARSVITALTAAETAQKGVSAALAATKGIQTATEGTSTASKIAATVATWGLTAAEYALTWPVLAVVAAVVAVIAILMYLYNTNSTVRNSVNQLIAIFQRLASIVAAVVSAAIQKAVQIFNQVKNVVTSLGSSISGTLVGAWNSLKGAVSAVISPLQNVYNMINNIISAIPNMSGLSQYFGFSSGTIGTSSNNTLNENLSLVTTSRANATSGTSSGDVTVNINGIIENDAKQWVVDSLNETLAKENLIRGK